MKMGDTPQEKWSWEPSGSNFRRFNALFSILAPFLVNSGSILGHPGSIFKPFGFCFWLGRGEICFFGLLLRCCVSGLLGCWAVGLLGCFAGLLGCWVVGLGCWVVG